MFHPDSSSACTFQFDTAGEAIEFGGLLRHPLDANRTNSVQVVRDEQGTVLARIGTGNSGQGWGTIRIFRTGNSKVVAVKRCYLNGGLQAIDSVTVLHCPGNAAEAGKREIVQRYRSGAYLERQQAYFNENYCNRYSPCVDWKRNEDCNIIWRASCEFQLAHRTTDSFFFTKPLAATFIADSLYYTEELILPANGNAVSNNKLPFPAFNEPFAVPGLWPKRTCGTINPPFIYPETVYQANQLPSVKGLRYIDMSHRFEATHYFKYTCFEDR